MPNLFAPTGNTEYSATRSFQCIINPSMAGCQTSGNVFSTVGVNGGLTRQPSITTLPNGTTLVSSQSTLDKLLAFALQNVALLKGSPYIPTTQQPVQQPVYATYNPNQNPYSDSSAGANFGAGIESFVKNNTGLIAVGVVAYVLFKSGRK